MKGKSRGRRKSRINQPGKTCHVPIAGKIRANNNIPRDQPRVSSSTNDNQCVIQLKPLLLTGSPTKKTMNTVKCKAKCCKFCSYCARAFSKERNKSRGSRLLLEEKQIKVCEKCFLCHSIVLCQLCNKCSQCCHKSACRGQTAKLLEKMVRPGCRSESGSNLERGLHPPLSNSHSHKLLWQSSQKSETVRGITSAYGQKCHRTSPQTDLTRVFQPTIFLVPKPNNKWRPILDLSNLNLFLKTKKFKMEAPETIRTRVGNLHRLQGHLLPYSDTGTIQEILEISYPRPNLSVQSTTVRPVNSAHGVHCNSQRGETDGHSKGYKDPPIPQRLVGESHIPPGLSPTYTSFSENVPGSRLDGELREVRAGTKASFQLCRLPVRPRVRSGLTDTGLVAESTRKNIRTASPSDMFSKGVHVLDRFIDSHRKAGSPRQITHEAHLMASQKQLEDSGIPRKGYSSTQVFTSPFPMVAKGKQCPHRPTITPNTACSANLYRRIKRRVGRLRVHCQRKLVPTRKQATHKLSGTQSSLSSFKRVPRSMRGQNGSCSNRQHHSSSLH